MNLREAAIDFRYRFMPVTLTPLFHTPCYCALTQPEQVRYNQLQALYSNEQIIIFEQTLAQNIITPLSEPPEHGARSGRLATES